MFSCIFRKRSNRSKGSLELFASLFAFARFRRTSLSSSSSGEEDEDILGGMADFRVLVASGSGRKCSTEFNLDLRNATNTKTSETLPTTPSTTATIVDEDVEESSLVVTGATVVVVVDSLGASVVFSESSGGEAVVPW